MLDIGFMEIFVIGALALIVVGPKDLPGLLRTVGQFVAKARGMAREFQRTMEDAARDADLGDVADVVKGKSNLNKLPFDNQIVDSMKEFERSVKAGVDGAKTEFDKPDTATPKVDPGSPTSSVTKAEAPKPDPAAPTPTAATPKAPARKAAAAKKPAAKSTTSKAAAAKKPAARKPATKAPAAAKAPAKTAAKAKTTAKPKAATKAPAKSKTTPEKSA